MEKSGYLKMSVKIWKRQEYLKEKLESQRILICETLCVPFSLEYECILLAI